MKRLLVTAVCFAFLTVPLMGMSSAKKNDYKINITNMCKFSLVVIPLNSKWVTPITSINIKPGKTYTFDQKLNSGNINLAVSDPAEVWGKVSFDNGKYIGIKSYNPQSSYSLIFNDKNNNLKITAI
jgi:hypothetical protein